MRKWYFIATHNSVLGAAVNKRCELFKSERLASYFLLEYYVRPGAERNCWNCATTDHCWLIVIISKHAFSRTDKKTLNCPPRAFLSIIQHFRHLTFRHFTSEQIFEKLWVAKNNVRDHRVECTDTPHIYFTANIRSDGACQSAHAPLP